MILVSVIIVTHNSSSVIGGCISSISMNCTAGNYEVIVVDNDSTATEKEFLRSVSGIDTLLLHDKNSGFGTANNIGSKAARGDYLLFLNPDTVLLNDIISIFLEATKELDTFGVLGVWQKNPDLSENHSYGRFEDHRISCFIRNEYRQNVLKQCTSLFGIKRFKKLLRPSSQPVRNDSVQERIRFTQVDWINGACLFLKKQVFFDIGCFDEHIFLFSEEVDLQKRLLNNGYYSYLVDTPLLIHLHEDKRKMGNRTRIEFYRGYFVYAKKYYLSLHYCMLRFSMLVILIIGSFLDLFTRRYSVSENIRCIKSVCSHLEQNRTSV